jgi:SEC-C motif-containing protein
MKTTHPENAQFQENKSTWSQELEDFSSNTSFDGLKIEEFFDGEQQATVTFIAYIRQGSHDLSFKEKSTFAKVDNQWLYKGAEMLSA